MAKQINSPTIGSYQLFAKKHDKHVSNNNQNQNASGTNINNLNMKNNN